LTYQKGATNMDGFPEDLLEVVNDHWGKFPPAHPMIVSFFGTFYLLVTMVCVLGNGLLIYVFLSAKHLRTPVSFKVSKVKLIDFFKKKPCFEFIVSFRITCFWSTWHCQTLAFSSPKDH